MDLFKKAPSGNNADIEGLDYRPDFLDTDAEARLVRFLDRQHWRNDLARRVQHYGYVYDYRVRQVRSGMYLGQLPAAFRILTERLVSESFFNRVPDQVIVNEYLPGQGIAPHTDCIPCFGDTIASISLLSACEMAFLQSAAGKSESLILEPRSALILSGPARYEWQHGIRGRKSDFIGGIRQPRDRRISLTFRTVTL